MSTSCPDLLAALHQRRRDLELDAVAVKSRIEEVAELIAMLEQPQRKRGRPPGPRAVFTPRRVTPANPPLHVAGAVHEPFTVTTHTDTDDDELPLQSDAPGA